MKKVFKVIMVLLVSFCVSEKKKPRFDFMTEEKVRRGEKKVVIYGCHNCHQIPGLIGNPETIGPSLKNWSDRKYIVGQLENLPSELIKWLEGPHKVEELTAMPDLSLSEKDASDIAAFLYSL